MQIDTELTRLKSGRLHRSTYSNAPIRAALNNNSNQNMRPLIIRRCHLILSSRAFHGTWLSMGSLPMQWNQLCLFTKM